MLIILRSLNKFTKKKTTFKIKIISILKSEMDFIHVLRQNKIDTSA